MKPAPTRRAKQAGRPPRPARSQAREAFLKRFADPAVLVDTIELQSGGAHEPYWRRFEELVLAGIEHMGDVDESHGALHLRQLAAGRTLQGAARQAGFVMGFEYCRELLSPERLRVTRKRGAK